MKIKSICARGFWVVASLAATLCGCGGGGGGGGGSSSTSGPVTVSGWIFLGPVNGADVQLLSVGSDGSTQLLDESRTAADGSYAFHASPASGTVIMVSASGGSYPDEASAATRDLSVPLRALQAWTGSPLRVSVTPFSEAATRTIAQATSPDWSATHVASVNADFADWLGADSLTDFQPLDLRSTLSAVPAESDVEGSLMSGAFSEFALHLDGDPDTSLSTGLDAITHLLGVDRADDHLFPVYVAAMVQFIDLTALSDGAKSTAKSEILYLSAGPMSATQEAQGLPTGTSSGGATAPMIDNAFQMIDVAGATTHFNQRGALVEYTDPSQQEPSTSIYTASVAEVFGDGDVGMGRWNGGTIARASSLGAADVTITPMTYPSFQYGVAKVPTATPDCGLRRLALVASTTPSLRSLDVNAQQLYTGITSDSTVGLQYLDGTYAGADIGLQAADGSVVRFQTLGASASPWLTGLPLSAQQMFLSSSNTSSALGSATLLFEPLVSGAGANKVVVHLSLPYETSNTEMEAVFVDSTGAPDTSACGQTGAPGAGIAPQPSDGQQYVFLNFDSDTTFRGAPDAATFGSSGQLQTVLGTFTLAGPAFDLAGNADASIGRLLVTDTSSNKTRTEPYAVVRPDTMTTPSTGTYIYDLVASTATVPERGTAKGGVLPGQVSTATLTITFGQYPVGTPSPYYGTAQLIVQGNMGGHAFSLSSDGTATGQPLDARLYGQSFGGNQFSGALSAPGGDYVAVTFGASIGEVPLDGSLLFRKR